VDEKCKEMNKNALDYAWNWFEYHAHQRMTSFNFFLILAGVIVAGYLKCAELAQQAQSIDEGIIASQFWWLFCLAISLFGILVSIAFWLLDIRNAELVNCGRNSLRKFENSLNITIREDDEGRKYLSKSLDLVSRNIPKSWLPRVVRYGFWLRTIMVFAAIAFLFSALFSLHQILICDSKTMILQNASSI
jgi:hypothetical protein